MISITTFRGVAPILNPRHLADGMAQVALNVDAVGSTVKPIKGLGATLKTLTKSGDLKTIYRFGQDVAVETDYWFAWSTDVDVCRGQIAGDASEWTFWTGDGFPKATYNALALSGGGTDLPVLYRRLGIPAPDTALTTVATAGTTTEPMETRVYTWTWVNKEAGLEVESAPAPPSSEVSLHADGTVALSGFAGAPSSSGVAVTHRRIYRSVAGTYLYVAEIPVAQTTYTDALLADNLEPGMPSSEWAMLPDAASGLISLPNGMNAAFLDRDVFLCEPYRPYAWPDGYRHALDYKIVGLANIDTTLVVLTEGVPYLLQGSAPENVVAVKSSIRQACVSKRSIVSLGGMVLYASPDGLVKISQGSQEVITQALFTRAQWQALNPSAIHAYGHDNQYVAFYAGGGFVYDLTSGTFSMHSVVCNGAYVDLRNDTLYCIDAATKQIKKWGAGGAMAGRWRSKKFTQTKVTGFSCAQIEAESYPVTARFYADSSATPFYTATVTSRAPFRLPTTQAREFEVELDVSSEVFLVTVASSMSEIARG